MCVCVSILFLRMPKKPPNEARIPVFPSCESQVRPDPHVDEGALEEAAGEGGGGVQWQIAASQQA